MTVASSDPRFCEGSKEQKVVANQLACIRTETPVDFHRSLEIRLIDEKAVHDFRCARGPKRQSFLEESKHMNDWQYAQNDPREQLAQLHFFSMKKLRVRRKLR
jgi:hypothetical protein